MIGQGLGVAFTLGMSATILRLRRLEGERMTKVFTDGHVVVEGVDDYPST